MMQNILLATDGSEASRAAAVQAEAISRVFASQLHVLFVSSPYAYLSEQERNAFNVRSRQQAELEFSRLKASFADLEGNTLFRVGQDTAQTIVEVANEFKVDLIVLGSHGRTGLNRFVLGSVASDVVNKAGCNVMVCKTE